MTQPVRPRTDRVDIVDQRSIMARAATDDAIPLARLLGVVTLTPAQAAHLGRRILELPDGELVVGRDGSLRHVDGTARTIDGQSGVLLAELARNADRPAARRRPEQAAVLAAVQRSADLLDANGVDAARRELVRTLDRLGDPDGAAVQRELAALVAVITERGLLADGAAANGHTAGEIDRRATPTPGPPVAAANGHARVNGHATTEAAPATAQHRSPIHVRPPVRLRWIAAGTGILVLIAIICLAVLLPGGGSPAPLHTKTPPAHRPSAVPTHVVHPVRATGPSPVPALAPRAAGDVRSVSITPLDGACQAGRSCPVTVTVHVTSSSTSRTVSWHAVAIDRCTGARHALPGGVLDVQPGWTGPYDTPTLQLPAGRALAVVALTEQPVAASAPLLVPPHATC
jgi:hypothetical protein